MKYQISKSILRLTGITVAVLILISTSSYFLFAAGAPSSTDAGGGLLRQSQANGNGLVAEYKFDGDAKDLTANSNNGSLIGSPTYTRGKFGNALSLNGSSQYVNVPNTASLQFGSGSFSFSGWYYPLATKAFVLFSEGNTGGCNSAQHIFLQAPGGATGPINLYLLDANSAGFNITSSASVNASLNQWHHLSVVIDRSITKVIFNFDGAQVGTSQDVSTVGNLNPASALLLGIQTCSGNYGLVNGYIDDYRFYNRALSATEITNLYQGSSPANCDQFCSSYLKLDDGTGTTALNAIRGGSNATLNNFTFTSTNGWTSGVFGGGLLLDGISDYVSLPDQAMTSGTVEFWVNPTTITGDQRLFSQASGATTQAGALSLNQSSGESGSLWVWDGTAWQRLADTGTIGRGFWNHIIVAYNGSSVTAYINGVQTYTTTAACAFSGVPISIGGKSFGSAGNTYSGVLDDFRIYKRFLQPEEAAEHYRLGI